MLRKSDYCNSTRQHARLFNILPCLMNALRGCSETYFFNIKLEETYKNILMKMLGWKEGSEL